MSSQESVPKPPGDDSERAVDGKIADDELDTEINLDFDNFGNLDGEQNYFKVEQFQELLKSFEHDKLLSSKNFDVQSFYSLGVSLFHW